MSGLSTRAVLVMPQMVDRTTGVWGLPIDLAVRRVVTRPQRAADGQAVGRINWGPYVQFWSDTLGRSMQTSL